ncbi:hypothetical protein CEXT_20111 [Caerostris extrusa]|uniref:Ig-like domain-containing protein n=1 Tax=Caerostris extrusa TaxID=172846 RepID=A0AAV4PXH5_CAEEX|nr:hypothetical protein CEXT_20111 [Caerostris extrusa]
MNESKYDSSAFALRPISDYAVKSEVNKNEFSLSPENIPGHYACKFCTHTEDITTSSDSPEIDPWSLWNSNLNVETFRKSKYNNASKNQPLQEPISDYAVKSEVNKDEISLSPENKPGHYACKLSTHMEDVTASSDSPEIDPGQHGI